MTVCSSNDSNKARASRTPGSSSARRMRFRIIFFRLIPGATGGSGNVSFIKFFETGEHGLGHFRGTTALQNIPAPAAVHEQDGDLDSRVRYSDAGSAIADFRSNSH